MSSPLAYYVLPGHVTSLTGMRDQVIDGADGGFGPVLVSERLNVKESAVLAGLCRRPAVIRRALFAGDRAGKATTMADPQDDSVAALLRQLSQQTATLVHQELELAKAEFGEKGKKASVGAGLFGGTGIVAVLALGALVTAGIAGLYYVVPLWAAALIAAGALLVIAGVLALVGKRELSEGAPPVPTGAVQSTKEDIEWLKTQTQSAKP